MWDRDDNLFKALADTQRRRILAMLRQSEMPAGMIAEQLGLTPATASHHLAKLKAAGLVRTRREGQQRIYAINLTVVEEAMLLLNQLLRNDKD